MKKICSPGKLTTLPNPNVNSVLILIIKVFLPEGFAPKVEVIIYKNVIGVFNT